MLRGSALVILLLIALASRAAGETPTPEIQPGAIELGLSGAWTAVEGTSRADIGLGIGSFVQAGAGLAGAELRVGYAHVRSLDQLDLEASLSWQRALRGTSIYPYVAVGGGVREVWVGSFHEARFPVGVALGLRMLAAPAAGARVEFRWRRLMHDPIEDFTESELRFGLTLYLRNV